MYNLLIIDDTAVNKWNKSRLERELPDWKIQLFQPTGSTQIQEIVQAVFRFKPTLLILDQQIITLRGSDIAIEIRNMGYCGMIAFDSSDTSYRQIISSIGGRELDQDDKYGHLKDLVRDAITYKFTQSVPIKSGKGNFLILSILHLFLPLDIDMQALELLKDEERKKYLDEMYKDNIDYANKFEVLQSKIKELAEVKEIDSDRLNSLVKEAEPFFQNLNRKETNPEKLLNDSWEGKDIKSFHDWYCALAECLRGQKACKG